ncbi:MAG: DUF1318 domain-containing protein [Spirochaetota bacterium]|nr:DUF1318 domain-containing protein [Spirochaetota bacterium]
MNCKRILIITISLWSYVIWGCSSSIPFLKDMPSCCLISPPKIHLTGEKTVVERQIVGDYRELEKDSWAVSSVKTNVQRSKGMTITGQDKDLLLAYKIREFHEEKIRKNKDEGAIGEENSGFIAYIQMSKYENNKDLKKLLMKLIQEENKARNTIFKRTLLESGIQEVKEEQISAFGKRFAEEQRAMARKGDWVQDITGKWIRKK